MRAILDFVHWVLTLLVLAAVIAAGLFAWHLVGEFRQVYHRFERVEKILEKLPHPFHPNDDRHPWNPFRAEDKDFPPLTDAEAQKLEALLDEMHKHDPDSPDGVMTEECYALFIRALKNNQFKKDKEP